MTTDATAARRRPRCSVFIATSVDGFIARPDGSLDWLTGRPAEEETGQHEPNQDFGYSAFMSTIDAMVIGRGTFDVVAGFEGDWPYGATPVYVWTSHPDDLIVKDGAIVRPVQGTVDEVVERVVADGIGHVYVDGGVTIRQFLSAGLIDRMVLSTVPVLIGQGIPLFGHSGPDIALDLVSCETFPGGMVQRTYELRDT